MDYNSAVNNFYTLKQKYEKSYQKMKKNITRLPISKKEKKRRIQRLKQSCIKCNRKVGTIFTVHNRTLKAVCGDTDNPCDLHIFIKQEEWRIITDIIQQWKQYLETIKRNIISTKLRFLFSLENEEKTIQQFNKLKTKFEEFKKELLNLENQQKEQYAWKERNDIIKEKKIILYGLNEEFKKAIAQYQNTKNISFLRDAITSYIDNIIPTEEEIQANLYAYMQVEESNNEYILVQKKITPLQEEILYIEGEVISNKK